MRKKYGVNPMVKGKIAFPAEILLHSFLESTTPMKRDEPEAEKWSGSDSLVLA